MKQSMKFSLVAASAVLLASGAAQAMCPAGATSCTNVASSVLTVIDTCDISAVGADFGSVSTGVLETSGVAVAVANTAAAQATGSGDTHGERDEDGGGVASARVATTVATEDTDDTVDAAVLTAALGALPVAVPAAITNALGTVTGVALEQLPGLYVLCTKVPATITFNSEDAATNPASWNRGVTISNATGTTTSNQSFRGTLFRYTGDSANSSNTARDAANYVTYEMAFTGAVVNLAPISIVPATTIPNPLGGTLTIPAVSTPGIFVLAMPAIASIPAQGAGTTSRMKTGDYMSRAIFTLNF